MATLLSQVKTVTIQSSCTTWMRVFMVLLAADCWETLSVPPQCTRLVSLHPRKSNNWEWVKPQMWSAVKQRNQFTCKKKLGFKLFYRLFRFFFLCFTFQATIFKHMVLVLLVSKKFCWQIMKHCFMLFFCCFLQYSYIYCTSLSLLGKIECVIATKSLNETCSSLQHVLCAEEAVYPSSLWGPSLDQLDQVVERCLLPELSVGDWLLFSNMGANGLEEFTCLSTSSQLPVYYTVSTCDWWVWSELACEGAASNRSSKRTTCDSIIDHFTSCCPQVRNAGSWCGTGQCHEEFLLGLLQCVTTFIPCPVFCCAVPPYPLLAPYEQREGIRDEGLMWSTFQPPWKTEFLLPGIRLLYLYKWETAQI